jgi:3-isopropylmalate/(R)-2-methylmalate dehydratase small subunit
VDTDQIIPARFLKVIDKQGVADKAFSDWREDPQFVLNAPESQDAQILLAGDNFGCGSSREHAPWALMGWGFRVIIASSFADIFRNNALKNGLLPVSLPAADVATLFTLREQNPKLEITVDLLAERVLLPDDRKMAFSIDSFARHCLINGIDQLGYLLDLNPSITAYENQKR